MVAIVKFILVVLGCHIPEIQKDRITSAIKFAQNIDSPIWFLSGGVKDGIMKEEAVQMQECISDTNIILDTKSRNTAENFVNLKKWIDANNTNYQIVITTSEFHKERAELIFKGVFGSINAIWNLAPLACSYCWNNEKVHIKNVESDLQKALLINDLI
jgi:uncharacterized SAM-binding protein YcdF (DUF218 family)